ncbi:40008_t:CDS:2, partial [Gigaspora margarita]
LEVTISEDRNANVKKHETNINCAPPISGYGTQYYMSPVSGYETQINVQSKTELNLN